MPAFAIKRMLMANYTEEEVEAQIADSIDFMVERVSFWLWLLFFVTPFFVVIIICIV